MEKCIVDELLKFLLTNHMISKQQHGFLSRKSTETNLLESLNDWTINIENSMGQSIAYTDFAKAFDSVCHSKLIVKLSKYGIAGNLLLWIQNFLSGRTHRTRVGDCLSSIASITSGVVQGSCLGPILFLLYVNDLPSVFSHTVTVKLYADDIKLYSNVDLHAPATAHELQDQLNNLCCWASEWQLPISYSKCFFVFYW